MSNADKSTYAPFILIRSEHPSLILSDREMSLRFEIFDERKDDGWVGNGYDWTSIAQIVMEEKLPDVEETVEFDAEAGMFSAIGPLYALERLGGEMKKVFDDENLLRDVLNRAEID